MGFKPIMKMWDRIEVARQDSDTSLFYDLLYLGEMLTKTVAAGIVAAITDDRQRNRYRQIYRLVRADGLGDWSMVIDDILHRPASQDLFAQASEEKRELVQRVGPGTWQYDSCMYLHNCVKTIITSCEDIPTKVNGCWWFLTFVILRNKTRGHGALPTDVCSKLCPDLEQSIRILTDNYCLFKRHWAYLHRHLSGKYRITKLTDNADLFDPLKSDSSVNFPDGVYVHFGKPAFVELIKSNIDAMDFFFPNGSFGDKQFELLSYITNDRFLADSVPYMIPTGELPVSETQGIGVLDIQGNCFGNLPPLLKGYIHRQRLESKFFDVLTDDRHPIISLVGRGGIGKTSLALCVLHQVADCKRFEAMLWFSARDTDLLPQGPKLVKPHVLTKNDIAAEFVRLMDPQEAKDKGFKSLKYIEEAFTKSPVGPILWIFDNFETVSNPAELFLWIDTYIRPSNKVLITTRHRDFKGDYYIDVEGMSEHESEELISSTAIVEHGRLLFRGLHLLHSQA